MATNIADIENNLLQIENPAGMEKASTFTDTLKVEALCVVNESILYVTYLFHKHEIDR